MDDDVKICPECGAEYFAHVEMCGGCDVALVRPGEQVERVRPDDGQLVSILQGPQDRIQEYSRVIAAQGMECHVLNPGGSGCSPAYGLFVNQHDAEDAVRAIEQYTLDMHPELLETDAKLRSGLCPACGASLSNWTTSGECPDCGLNLEPGGGDCGTGCGPGSC